jgi:predicted amidohydrolase
MEFAVPPGGGQTPRQLRLRAQAVVILQAKENNADVLVTQECALSGYPPIEIESVKEINFEKQEKELQKIKALAKENGIHVLLGLIRKADDQIKNSVAIISPSKTIDYYDKRALWGWDLDNYSPGTISNGIVIINGIKIGIRICFEIRFPEYFRELYKENVDIAIFLSEYEVPYQERNRLIESMIQKLSDLVEYMEQEASNGDVKFQKDISEGHHLIYQEDIRYLIENKSNINIDLERIMENAI